MFHFFEILATICAKVTFKMLEKLFRKYFTGVFFLNAPLVINTTIALVILPIILANLPVADYGKWQFVLALQIWFTTFSATHITSVSKRGIAKGLNGTFLYVFLARLKLLVPISILVLGIAFYFRILGYHIFSVLLSIMGLFLVFGYLFQINFYEFLIAKKRFKDWSFWRILISSVSIVGSTAVAYFTKNIVYFALFQLGSISVLSLIAWVLIIKKESLIQSYKKGEIDKECVPYGLKLIPVDLISVTANKISHFIIGPFFGFSNLAIFSVGNKLRNNCASIINSARPLLYGDFAKRERKELIKIINSYLIKVGILSTILTLGFIAGGWFYIKFFLPESFHKAILYFVILVLGLPVGILAVVLHTVLESHLRYKELAAIGIILNLLRIVLILILGYFWQIIGVCIALAMSGWISFGFYYLFTAGREKVIGFLDNHPVIKGLVKRY